MSMPIFVALSTYSEFGDAPLALLRASGHPFRVNTLGRRLTRDEVIALSRGSVGIIAGVEPYDAEVLAQLPELRCISRCGVGTDNIDRASAKARGIVIRNTPDVVVQPVAEMAIAMMFDLLKRLSQHTGSLRRGQWQKYVGNLMVDQVVGVVGLGRIGRRLAELLRRWDVRVIGTDPNPDRVWAERVGVSLQSLEVVLTQADIVSLHLAAPATPFVLSEAAFRQMKPGALLVNVARGSFVDEGALYTVLQEGHLGGAALDVFSKEPYTGPLCELDNVILTPHVATLTRESRVSMEIEATRNVLETLAAR